MTWFETLPDWIKTKIQMEHEIEAMAWMMGKDIREGKATDAEMCAALYCANLHGPIDYNAGQIYLFICTRLLEEKGWAVPEDIRVTELNSDQTRTLNEWRHMLYRKRGKAETTISRAIKQVFRERRKASKPESPNRVLELPNNQQPSPVQSDMHMQEAETINAAGASE